MGATVRLFRVNSVSLALMKKEPPVLAVTAQGLAATPGYSNIRLNVLEGELSPDGIFDLELVGEAPDGIVPQMITPVTASTVIERDVAKIVGVIVHARSNNLTELLGSESGAAAFGGVQGAALDADLFGGIQGRPFTTLALGEEGTTWPFRFSEGTGPFVMEKDFRIEKEFRFEKDPRPEVFKPVGNEDFDPFGALTRRNPFGSR